MIIFVYDTSIYNTYSLKYINNIPFIEGWENKLNNIIKLSNDSCTSF